MNKLKELTVEKFRIMKDAELKGIVGGLHWGHECTCGGGCNTVGFWNGHFSDSYYSHDCVYSSIARTCVCGGV